MEKDCIRHQIRRIGVYPYPITAQNPYPDNPWSGLATLCEAPARVLSHLRRGVLHVTLCATQYGLRREPALDKRGVQDASCPPSAGPLHHPDAAFGGDHQPAREHAAGARQGDNPQAHMRILPLARAGLLRPTALYVRSQPAAESCFCCCRCSS